MEDNCKDPVEGRHPLPRDVSRFKRLYPNGRAKIRKNADKTLGYISTIELTSSQGATSSK